MKSVQSGQSNYSIIHHDDIIYLGSILCRLPVTLYVARLITAEEDHSPFSHDPYQQIIKFTSKLRLWTTQLLDITLLAELAAVVATSAESC